MANYSQNGYYTQPAYNAYPAQQWGYPAAAAPAADNGAGTLGQPLAADVYGQGAYASNPAPQPAVINRNYYYTSPMQETEKRKKHPFRDFLLTTGAIALSVGAVGFGGYRYLIKKYATHIETINYLSEETPKIMKKSNETLDNFHKITNRLVKAKWLDRLEDEKVIDNLLDASKKLNPLLDDTQKIIHTINGTATAPGLLAETQTIARNADEVLSDLVGKVHPETGEVLKSGIMGRLSGTLDNLSKSPIFGRYVPKE